MKQQKAVVVKVEIVDGGLNVDSLNAVLAEGWTVASTTESTPGSILVIVEREVQA